MTAQAPSMCAKPDFPDWLSPMLVKELRQGMRSGTFLWSFILLQAAMVCIAVLSMLGNSSRAGRSEAASFYWAVITVLLLIVMPTSGLAVIVREKTANAFESLFLTQLNGMRIMRGKWIAVLAQSLLLVTAILPYAVLRYYLGATNVVSDLEVLAGFFAGSVVLTGVAIGIGPWLSRPLSLILAGGLLCVLAFPFITLFALLVEVAAPFGHAAAGWAALIILLGTLVAAVQTALFFGADRISPVTLAHSITSPLPEDQTASGAAIWVRDLHRSFDNVRAVNGLNFEMFAGEVVGFIGANGAGKTTAMRIMATLDYPDRGWVRICGSDVMKFPHAVREKMGWMPDSLAPWPNMTVFEYLDFYGRAYGMRAKDRLERLREVMDFTDLTGLADRPMDKLSRGMGQRLCFGRAIMHDPDVLIMDEPAAGLDPKARIEFKRLIRILADQGKTIFISSHILSELAEMCDSLLFIDAGRVFHHGPADSLLDAAEEGSIVTIQLAGDQEALHRWACLQRGVSHVEESKQGARIHLEAESMAELSAFLRKMIDDGLPVSEFHRETRRLEDAFVEILKKVEPAREAKETP